LPPPRTLDAASLRVAVWSHQPGQGTSAETVALIEQAGRYLSGLGATVDTAARPAIDPIEAYHLYLMLLDAALSSRLPPAAIAARRDRLAALAADDMSADAVMLRATGIEHGAWLALNERRARIRLAWSAFFREWDVLLCPVVATPAYQHQHEGNMLSMRPLMVDGQAMGYAEQLFWPGITGGFHLPATVAPLGLSAEGLPIGVQIAGPLFGDLTTLAVAEMLERGFRAFEAPPAGRGFAPAPH
jgi:amidase